MPAWRRAIVLLLAAGQVAGGALTLALPAPAAAAVRTNPAWWNGSNGAVGTATASSWHYRVPITVPNGTPANATVRLNVDFAALLASMGVAGTLDVGSPRVVDASGTLVSTQEFTDSIYNGATDASNNSRGEVRFILPSDSTTYWLYFDTTANGAKAALAGSYLIGGNFENSTTGTLQPPGWTVTRSNNVFDAQVRPTETLNITTNGSVVGSATRSVTGAALTGGFSYLLGARTSNEPNSSGQNIVVMSRTFTVPATNAGNLMFRYRVQGWDSNDDGNTTQYDYMLAELRTGGVNGTVVRNLVGPDSTPNLVPYTTFPYSPNKGTSEATSNRSGYGQYNGFDTDTSGNHRAGMTVARNSEPWWTVTQDLSAWAGQTVTLRIATSYTSQYKSWWHLDDIEWSVVSGSLGTAQSFGAVLQQPAGAATTVYYPDPVASNRRLVIRAQLDAVGATGAVLADLYGPNGALVAGSIPLYNDGTRGDAVAGDAVWTNDGSGSPSTYTFPAAPTAQQLGTWTVVLRARDAAGAEIRIQGQPATPVNGSNFYNVDSQTLSLQNFNTVTGRVYVDANRNGIYNAGTDPTWSAPPNLFVKLVQNGAVVAVATPSASTGIYTFGSLRAGRYTVVPSANNSIADPNPGIPTGYTLSQPNEMSATIDVADGQTVNNDIGLYASDLAINGRVLVDNGAGGGTALDGAQGGSEQGHAGVVVQAATTGGTVLAQATTAGDGGFSLGLPAASLGAPVVLSVQTPSTHQLARVFAGTTGGALNPGAGTLTFTPSASGAYGNVVFSTLPVSVLTAGQMKTAPAGTTVFYAHRLSVGATGTLSFGVATAGSVGAPPGWTGVLYQDAGCTGTLNGSESPIVAPMNVTAGSQVCLVLRDSIPAAAQLNQDATHTITATLTVGPGAFTAQPVSNADITTVGSPQNSGLTLVKAVRNLTTSGAFGTSGQALPGQSLQYQLTFRNDTATPVSNVQINDAVPAYGVFDSAACGSMPAGVTCAVAVQPAGGATTGALQWNLTGPVPAGASGTVTFNWTLSN